MASTTTTAASDYSRRNQLLHDYAVPLKQETTEFLRNSQLADVVLHTMSATSQRLMGVSMPLSTPPAHLWISPQDHLDGNVVLTQPLTLVCLKAFTHQTIMELGAGIEQKAHRERSAAISAAVAETEAFEQFECGQRVAFSVQTERAQQQSARELERNDLLQMFREERDQLIGNHAAELAELSAALARKCEAEVRCRVAEEVARVERQCVEAECRWRLEEAILRVFIDDARKRQEEAVAQTQNDYQIIFRKLFHGFVVELHEQRDDMYCRHLSELMHVICVEKSIAAHNAETLKIDLGDTIQTLQTQIDALQNAVDPNAEPRPCTNLLKLKLVFTNMLKQYADFVEWSLGENNEQGKYLISVQKCLADLLLEQQHPHGFFDCCATFGVPVSNALAQQTRAKPAPRTAAMQRRQRIGHGDGAKVAQFLPHDRRETEDHPRGGPLFVAACEVKSEPSIAEEVHECTPVSSSLSCFDFDGKIYASNKHYNDLVDRYYPDDENKPEMEWDEEVEEELEHAESIHDLVNEQIEAHVTRATVMLAGELARTEDENDTAIMHRHLSRLVHNILAELNKDNNNTNDSQTTAHRLLRGRYPNNRFAILSKLLSAADSLEMITQHMQRRSGMLNESEFVDVRAEQSHAGTSTLDDMPGAAAACTQTIAANTATAPATLPAKVHQSTSHLTDTAAQCNLLLDQPQQQPAATQQPMPPIGAQNHIRLLDNVEYMRSLQSVPPYMRAPPSAARTFATVWDYRVTDDDEWQDLLVKVNAWADLSEKRVQMTDKSTATSHTTAAAAAAAATTKSTADSAACRRTTMRSTMTDTRHRRTTTDVSPSATPRSTMSCYRDDDNADAPVGSNNVALKGRKRAKTILRLDRRTDGRWNGLTVAKLLTRLHDDADISELLERKIVL